VWNRREWLLGGAGALSAWAADDDEDDSGWQVAFRFDSSRVFFLPDWSPGTGLPDGARRIEPDPDHKDYRESLYSAGEPASGEPYQLLTGRQGLLRATAEDRVYLVDCNRHNGLRLKVHAADGSRFQHLRDRIHLVRPARRGPLVWNMVRPPRPARLNAFERNQTDIIIDQEMRQALRKPGAQATAKQQAVLRGRGTRELIVQELIGDHHERLLMARARWMIDRQPAYTLSCTIRALRLWLADTVDRKQPEALEAFSLNDHLHVVVRYESDGGAVYELWRREPESWRSIGVSLQLGC